MLIDPWIVLAEIFNFLILVVLLQRFLYKPILRTMATREQAIAERLQSAEARESEAQAQIEQYQQLQADWSAQTEARSHQMQQQLDAERNSQVEHIRQALATQKSQWEAALRQEQKASLINLRDRAQSQLIQTVRSALKTLANTTLEQQMAEAFITKLKDLSQPDLDTLRIAITQQQTETKNEARWIVRTTFPLSALLQQKIVVAIRDLIHTQLSAQVTADDITFETHPGYPCGVELRIGGYKLAWHLEHYLDSLESRLNYDLEQVPVL